MNAEQAIADHQRMLIHAAEDRREIAALRAQNAELVAALKFYAQGTANTAHKSDPEDWDVKDYSDGSTRSIAIKFGERARAALAAAGHKQGSGE